MVPVRSEFKNDVLALQRATRALDEAMTALKEFKGTPSVRKHAELAELLSDLMRRVKKARKRADQVAKGWSEAVH